MGRIYKVGEFAALTNVSVRTLHHYDRIGLLRPSAISEGGHRLYSENELLRLQQILTLRYLGFPLAQIRELLERPDFDLLASMQIQQRVMRNRIAELEQIESALGELVERRKATGQWDWDMVVQTASKVQSGHNLKGIDVDKYYTPEQMRQFEELGNKLGPEVIGDIERRWTELFADINANADLDPASPEAQALADRWDALRGETMSHYDATPDLKEAISENYNKGAFGDMPGAPGSKEFAFIQRVNEARKGS